MTVKRYKKQRVDQQEQLETQEEQKPSKVARVGAWFHRHRTGLWVLTVLLCSFLSFSAGSAMTIAVYGQTLESMEGALQTALGSQMTQQDDGSYHWDGDYLDTNLKSVDMETGLLELENGMRFQVQPGYHLMDVQTQIPAVMLQKDDSEDVNDLMVAILVNKNTDQFKDLVLVDQDGVQVGCYSNVDGETVADPLAYLALVKDANTTAGE